MTKETHDEQQADEIEEVSEDELDAEDEQIGTEQDVDVEEEEEEKSEESKLRDQLLRMHAQIDNAKRRAERDVSHAHKYANEKLLQELIPIMDSLEQALQTADTENDEFKTMREGMELTLQMFLSTLEKFGVKQINPLHEKFDPNQHEAMTMALSEEHEVNIVTTVIQKGYIMHGRVIRPARVIVAR